MPCARYPTASERPWVDIGLGRRVELRLPRETDSMSQVDVENQSKSQCGWNHEPISTSLLGINHGLTKVDRQ